MASQKETGHAKNVANFETLISYCNGYGADYIPANSAIQLSALNAKLQNARNAIAEVTTAETTVINAVNSRQQLFKPVKPLSTKAINALAASGASKEIIADARTIVRKLTGQAAAKAAKDPEPLKEGEQPKEKHRSTSQLSFDYVIEHLSALKELLLQEPLYTPAETDIQVDSLTTKVTALRNVTSALYNADVIWGNKRVVRNEVLYTAEAGLVDTALKVKAYVKSVFGASSQQYKQISRLAFKRGKDM
jgi:hypothetical protein